ncbi:hypothetical protein NDU88_002135 [Pleurodeles waltl]|uniref:Uncharacterized protein n=1 Tax=Pleurodeles waltl TaxID=8319 RepID=A0AAV7VYI4_PLEWA|nr:hypothetical protein NDU88_002135 [Pleurodeles waltl]
MGVTYSRLLTLRYWNIQRVDRLYEHPRVHGSGCIGQRDLATMAHLQRIIGTDPCMLIAARKARRNAFTGSKC